MEDNGIPAELDEPELDDEATYDSLDEEQKEKLRRWTLKKARMLKEGRKPKKTLSLAPTRVQPIGEVEKEKEPEQKPRKKLFKFDDSGFADVTIMGKYMLRDMPLFKWEFIAYIGLLVLVFVFYMIERIGLVEGMLGKIAIPAVILPMGIWFVKRQLYMPAKTRVPSMRIYKSGVIELGVESIKKGFVEWGSGADKQKKFITRLTKHTEASTGKPFLITAETRGENISLLDSAEPDMRSDEFNAILENEKAVVTKNVMNQMLSTVKPSMSNPLFILMAVNIALVAVLLVKSFGILDMIKG